MSETSGGSYDSSNVTWSTTNPLTVTVDFAEMFQDRLRTSGQHHCAPPYEDDGWDGPWDWTCPDCGRVHDKHASYWWAPREDLT